jgi:hypothetical protein
MHALTLEHILQRLQRVERANVRWRLATVAVSLVLGVVSLLGATQGPGTMPVEELRAMRVVLVDVQGRPMGRVGVEADGTPRLFLTDPNATPRVGLAVTADGRPGVTLYDGQGPPGWALAWQPMAGSIWGLETPAVPRAWGLAWRRAEGQFCNAHMLPEQLQASQGV